MQLFTHIYQLKLIPPTGKEKCLIKESGTYKGGWITLDTYLKRAGNKGDLRYIINKQ